MFKLGFKDKYKVLHINNELGQYSIGGAGTYMNEMYRYRDSNTGFVYMSLDTNPNRDFDLDKFGSYKDILVMNKSECSKIADLDFDIMVLQFYEFDYCIIPEILKDRKLVYVIHSVPTPEPIPARDPFGGNDDVKKKFTYCCERADQLVCVSEAEKRKLIRIFPHVADKTTVIYNGITFPKTLKENNNYKTSRKNFGFIGRTDYRKGIIECIKAFKNIDATLHLACGKNDAMYVRQMMDVIDACGLKDRVVLHGWCTGKRKEAFFDYIDALIIPSLFEPFGYVALEGMINGLPVISSKSGGLDEIMEGYKYKYDPYEDDALEKTIREFMQDETEVIYNEQQILRNNLNRFTAREMSLNYNRLLTEVYTQKKKGE